MSTAVKTAMSVAGFVCGLGLIVLGVMNKSAAELGAGASLVVPVLVGTHFGQVAMADAPKAVDGIEMLKRFVGLLPAQYQPLASAVLGDTESAIQALEAAAAAQPPAPSPVVGAQVAGAAAGASASGTVAALSGQ